MSEAFQPELLDNTFVPTQRRPLEEVPARNPEPTELFPAALSNLEAPQIRAYDQRALVLLGGRGIEGAFKTLDTWVRFSHSTQKSLDEAIDQGITEQALRTHQAARYIAKLRHKTILKSDSLPYSTDNYRRFPLYKHYSHLAQYNVTEKAAQDQLQTARVAITAVKLYRSLADPRPRTEERQSLIDLIDQQRSRTMPRPPSSPNYGRMVQRNFPKIAE